MEPGKPPLPDDPVGALGVIGVVPVVVIGDAAHAAPLAEALMAGGIRAAEITLRTSAALPALSVMAAYGGFLAGAGTVLEPRQVAQAADAGARFVVSPGFDPDVAHACQDRALPFVPGAVTATEVQRVRRAGIGVCKFFPAEPCGGLSTLAALSAPFPDMRFLPTGGIGRSNAPAYLACRYVHAVGGSWLAPRSLMAEGRWDRVRELAAEAATMAAARPRGRQKE